jgi:hypothetical protein
VQLRDTTGDPPIGTIDVRSHGFAVGDPPATATSAVAGTLPPGNLGVLGYGGQARDWQAAPPAQKANRLDIAAANVKSVTIDPRRAHVTCRAQLAATSDGPLTVTLAGCGRVQAFGP